MEKNHSLKARMYLGGLKSLFADMHDMIEGIEKTGNMPGSMLQNLIDVKEAVDLTVSQLKRATIQCCEHDDHCDDDDDDGYEDDDEYHNDGYDDDDLMEEEEEEEEVAVPVKATGKKTKAVPAAPLPTYTPSFTPIKRRNKKQDTK